MQPDQFFAKMQESIQEIAETMLFIEITPGESRNSHFSLHADVIATISFSQGLRGGFSLAAPKVTALKLAGALLAEERQEMDTEMRDAFGELANMIAGGIQMRLEEHLGTITIAPPVVASGTKVRTFYNRSFLCVSQYFELDGVAFVTEIFYQKESIEAA